MNFGPYTLRGLRSCKGREGVAWSATLYRDGRKVGEVADSANGGGADIHMLPRAEQEALLAHVATLPPAGDTWGGKLHMYAETYDTFLAALADYTEACAKARRLLRTRVMLITDAGELRLFRAGIKPTAANLAALGAARPVVDPSAPDAVERVARALCGAT